MTTKHTSSSNNAEFEDVFQHIPEFGCYQVTLYLGVCLLLIPVSMQFGLLVFAAGTPKFHCASSHHVNATCLPGKCCTRCARYEFDGPFTSTVSEWHLICSKSHLAAFSQASFLAGMLVGSLVSGVLSDTFGRRPCLMASCALMVLFSAASSLSNNLLTFALMRSGVGVAVMGLALTQYVYILELVGPTKRTMAGKLSDVFWVSGACVACLLSYLIRQWRVLLLVGSLPGIVFLLFWRIFPESARWLLAHGKVTETHALLLKYATGKRIDADALLTLLEHVHTNQLNQQDKARTYTPLDLVKTSKLRRRSFIVCFNWFVVSIVYFGFILFVSSLSGDFYLNFFIMSIIDVFNIPVTWYLLQRIGRRLTHSVVMVIGGCTCLLVMAVPKGFSTVVTVIAMVGKFCDTAAFSTIYLYTSELYPTVIRNIAMGSASMCARVGGIIAPYIVMLAQLPHISLTLPVVIFGVFSLAAGVLSLWLPETLHASMHQTIEEAEEAREVYRIPCCAGKSQENSQNHISSVR